MKKYTYNANRSDNKEKWYIVDAKGVVLGRLASIVASRIRGKMNPLFTPHADLGDWIIVINAEQVVLTGNKWDDKIYYRHSGYIGGLTETTAKDLRQKRPEDLVRKAVKGMLPKKSLGRSLNTKLFVYAGDKHPHQAQKPEKLVLPLKSK
ncbi:MAG: 50S ribosomal protein L13 [Desulfobacterales bacterium]|nr:50S ribosomal protein L13 [Desulfobacterales bacterium]